MQDGVKFIFKTLIKVPIIILVVYAIFNLFAFSFSYFRLLGFSYVAMQTTVENNYIPESEYNTLNNYLQSLDTAVLDTPRLECNSGSGNHKVQYGTPVTVTVSAHYRFIWPLMPAEQTTSGVAADGFDNSGASGNWLTDSQLDAARDAYESNPQNNIVISYTVPGLKYYPDLS